MITAAKSKSVRLVLSNWSMADVRRHLGNVPAQRIRVSPAPGTATERDVTQIADREGRHFELVDGILLEKTIGWYESLLAVLIGTELTNFVRPRKLGKVFGADGTLKILTGMVRIPDVSFVSRKRLSQAKLSRLTPIPALAPDLAVEVLSQGNTKREMQRKLRDYFAAGVQLVWYIDPGTRNAIAYTSVEDSANIGTNGKLSGGDVLPGFTLSLRDLFEAADEGAIENAD